MRTLIAILCLSVLLVGCGDADIGKVPNEPVKNKGLVEISRNVYCDTEYNVQYLYFNASSNTAVMSVRLDSNGKPIPCYK